ncbi:hypothetical protein ATANTOWER_000478 [Ataeniobius toweri]|uniref:Uncharacterized protein n=1 Tax=Ataeniobius toweri TaxID=208326 RepID=A0ABU7A3J8_9TELE|nr:hypothetical protein [Ataeniobius toweri]
MSLSLIFRVPTQKQKCPLKLKLGKSVVAMMCCSPNLAAAHSERYRLRLPRQIKHSMIAKGLLCTKGAALISGKSPEDCKLKGSLSGLEGTPQAR